MIREGEGVRWGKSDRQKPGLPSSPRGWDWEMDAAVEDINDVTLGRRQGLPKEATTVAGRKGVKRKSRPSSHLGFEEAKSEIPYVGQQ